MAPEVARHASACPWSCEYDTAGRVVERTRPSERVVSYTRDSTGRVTDVATKANASATPETVARNIEYLPFNRRYPAAWICPACGSPKNAFMLLA